MSKMSKQNNRGLGRGLSALMGIDDSDVMEVASNNQNNSELTSLPISLIEPHAKQPRKFFSQDSLRELADSIEKNGIIQPILVKKGSILGSKYQIIAGERRWRASKMAGLTNIPVIIREITEKETLEIALIENIQRQDLTIIEEAEGYQRLMDEFSYTQEELAETIGKSRSHIANLLRILTLPEEIKQHVNTGAISMGHAKILVTIPNNNEIAEKIIKNQLSVRAVEKLAKGQSNNSFSQHAKKTKAEVTEKPHDDDLEIIEKNISQKLGMKIQIEDGINGGKVTISFHNLEQLDLILKKLGGEL